MKFALALASFLCACGTAAPAGPIDIVHAPDLSRMQTIAASTFTMGHDDLPMGPYGQEWFENELPPHAVTLFAYAIDRNEVAVADYAAFLNEVRDPRRYDPAMPLVASGSPPTFAPAVGTERQPMRQVSWADAAAYCHWAGERLPTEAEWERAGKGDAGQQRYPWGDTAADCAHAVYFTGATFCGLGSQPAGSRSPLGDSPAGCADMAGNVAEWTTDWYGAYAPDAATDPAGPATGAERVVRGGGWLEAADWIRTTARWGSDPETRSDEVGFRCAVRTP